MITEQSAVRTIMVGPILDADGVAKTDEVVASIKIAKNGTVGALDGSATLTHDHTGNYKLALTANDLDTLGIVEFSLDSGTNSMGIVRLEVVPSNIFDALIAGTDKLEVDSVEIDSDATAATNLKDGWNGNVPIGDGYTSRQDQLNNLSTGASQLSVNADGAVITTGSETNSYTDTDEAGVIHIITAAAGNTDFYYEFDLSEFIGVAGEIIWTGYVQANNDTADAVYWEWSSSTWKVLNSLIGLNGTTLINHAFDIPVGATGVGANFGLVRFGFMSATSTNIGTDRVRCVFSQAISGIANGSTITLTEDTINENLVGENWSLVLNGQDISGSYIRGAHITGIASGTTPITVDNCDFGAVTIPPGEFRSCGIGRDDGLFTAASAGDYLFKHCVSKVAGMGTPDLAFAGLGPTTSIDNRGFNGGWNITLDADCTMSHEVTGGGGSTIVTGGADVEVRGIIRSLTVTASAAETIQFVGIVGPIILNGTTTATINLYGISESITDNTTAATITDGTTKKRFDDAAGDVWDEILTGATHNIATSAGRRLRELLANPIHTGLAQGPGANGNQIVLDTGAASVSGTYDPSLIAIIEGTAKGEGRLILQYDGPSRTATVDRDWKVLPDVTSRFAIYPHPGREHVNEGLARAGTINTIQLNSLAASVDNTYNGQTVFIRSGTGQDQIGIVDTYNGTSKIATMVGDWGTTPDTTSGYVMLANGPACVVAIQSGPIAAIVTGVWNATTRTLSSFGTLVADIWNRLTSALTAVGSVGKLTVDNLNATVSSRAAPGDEMDIVSSPNPTALAAMEASLIANTTITIDGTTTFGEILTHVKSMASGKFTVSGNVVTFYATDNTTVLYTSTIVIGGRTVA